MLVEWSVGYGILGEFFLLLWLFAVAKHSLKNYDIFGFAGFIGLIVANFFQANWMWEGWFFGLAFLYVISSGNLNVSAPQKETPR
jgi:hypothetical protein